MTVAADVRALWCALHDLRDAVLPVRLLAVEDRPDGVGEDAVPQPVQAVADGLDSVFGRLQQAIAELSDGIDTRARDRVVAALGRCHATYVELGREWTEQVSSYSRLAQLVVAARERGWRSWARSVVAGVLACERARDQVQLHLLACWQGLAEQGGYPDLPRTPLPRRRSDESGRQEQEERGRSGHGGRGPGDGGAVGKARPGDAAHHR